MKNKVFAAMLAAAMASSCMMCTVSAEETGETMKFTMMAGLNSSEDTAYAEGGAFSILCDNMNIEFDIQGVLLSDIGEKRGLIMASGDYPDCLFKTNMWDSAEIYDYGSQGILIPLEDLIREYAPNLTEILDSRDLWGIITSSDGHVYSIPEIDNETPAGSVMYFINQTWLENLGLEMPTDLDSWYTMLKAFKEQDANGNGDPDDEIPMILDATFCVNYLFPYFIEQYDYMSHCRITEDGQAEYAFTSELFHDFLEVLEQWYEEGLIYSESFVQSIEQRQSIGKSGNVLGSFLDSGPNSTVSEEYYADYTPMLSFTGSYPICQGVTVGTFAITDYCENPEVLIQWIDQWYTEEGGIYAWLGVEGVNYEVAEDGTYKGLEHDEEDSVPSIVQGGAHHPSILPDYYYEGASDEQTRRQFTYINELLEGGWSIPTWVYTAEVYEKINSIKSECYTYATSYQAEIITGVQKLEDSWEEYIEIMHKMGSEDMAAMYSELYAAMTE